MNSLNGLWKSFGYAMHGIELGAAQRNMRIHLVVALLAVLLGAFFHISETEWAVILLCIGLVLTAELLNTSFEETANIITKLHPEAYADAGRPKDIGAGAVLLAALSSLIVGVLIFAPKILMMISVN